MNALSSHAGAVTPNAYKYNSGTELTEDLDVDYYETYFRQYDAQTGRFTGVDLLSEKAYALSPYHYGANNPVMFNDPSGLKYDQAQPDYSAYWDEVLNAMWDESGPDGGNFSYIGSTGGGGGGGTWSGFSYNSPQDAVNSNLQNAIHFWNNQGWNTAGMLGYLSGKGYINISYGTNKNGDQGIYVSPYYSSRTVTEPDGIQWTYGDYSTGFFVKTGDRNDGGDKGGNSTYGTLQANTLNGAFGTAWGAKEQILELAAKTDESIKGLAYFKAVKGVSKGVLGVQIAISSVQVYSAWSGSDHNWRTNDGNKWGVTGKAALDITMGTIATFGGPVGWTFAGVYFLGDIAGVWRDWGEEK